MPIFEYRCEECDHRFELLVRGPMTIACPSCGSASVVRMLSMFAVSSDGTSQRNRQTLGADQRRQSQSAQKEKTFYKTDHHDD